MEIGIQRWACDEKQGHTRIKSCGDALVVSSDQVFPKYQLEYVSVYRRVGKIAEMCNNVLTVYKITLVWKPFFFSIKTWANLLLIVNYNEPFNSNNLLVLS